MFYDDLSERRNMDVKFSKTHEWVRIEGTSAVIGITDYAQKSLGDVVFVELPAKGVIIKAHTKFGTIESTKAASDLIAPISGQVSEINSQLVNNPQWVNESAQSKAWMIKVTISNLAELSGLMDKVQYDEFVANESH